MVGRKHGGGLVHRLMRWWREPSLADHLIQAEIDGPPSRGEDADLEARIRALGPGQKATQEETLAARRFRAIVTYGTEEEDPEEIALLTPEERERLEPIAIQSRWASFLRNQSTDP